MKRRRPSNQKILRKHWRRVLMWKTWLTICEFTRADSSWKDWKRRFVWSTWICYSTSQRRTESFWKKRLIVFENHRKSLNSTLRAKRATFTFCVDKSSLIRPKMVHFGEFLKTWSLRSNSVTRHVNLKTDKNWWKMPKLKNSNATFWVIFKHCETTTKPFFLRCIDFNKRNIWFLHHQTFPLLMLFKALKIWFDFALKCHTCIDLGKIWPAKNIKWTFSKILVIATLDC